MNNQCTCEVCHKTYDKSKEWSDSDAERELEATFPGFSPADCGVVCDDCYKLMGFSNE